MTIYEAAFNTIKARRLTLWLACVFGKKIIIVDSGCKITMRKYRGVMYFVDSQRIDGVTK